MGWSQPSGARSGRVSPSTPHTCRLQPAHLESVRGGPRTPEHAQPPTARSLLFWRREPEAGLSQRSSQAVFVSTKLARRCTETARGRSAELKPTDALPEDLAVVRHRAGVLPRCAGHHHQRNQVLLARMDTSRRRGDGSVQPGCAFRSGSGSTAVSRSQASKVSSRRRRWQLPS